MKRLLPVIFLILNPNLTVSLHAQSPDFISVRKKNGRSIKNVFASSRVVLQTTDGSYLDAPVKAIRNDSIFLTIYDVRLIPTIWGTRMRDTIGVFNLGLHYKDVARVHIGKRQCFFKRRGGTLLMLAGGGLLTTNVANGALFNGAFTDRNNFSKLIGGATAFFTGWFLNKLVKTDGFSGRRHRIEYIRLSVPEKPL